MESTHRLNAPHQSEADGDGASLSKGWNLFVLSVTLLALVVLALDDFPLVLVFVLMPVSVVAGAWAVAAAARPDERTQCLRAGHRALGLLCVLTLTSFLFSSGDWTHMLWTAQFPMAGLFFSAGLLLQQVWPSRRRRHADLLHGWNGAAVALPMFAILGAIPVLLTMIPVDARPAGRVAGAPLPALLDVARYGFGGAVPALMLPETADQVARGLGHPPRFVTVAMGSTMLAAGYWILFVALAFIGRSVHARRRRSWFFALTPLVLAPATALMLDRGVWSNEPWLVQAYGPVLLVAAAAALGLLIAVRRERRTTPARG